MSINKIYTRLKSGIVGNMMRSGLYMPINLLFSFLHTRLLLQYLGESSYGVWITITSLTAWVNYFDLGIGNGMRNSLVKAIQNKDEKAARAISATAYVTVSLISFLIFAVVAVVTIFIDTDQLFNSPISTKAAVILNLAFVCLNFVLSLCRSQLYAEQQAEKVGLIGALVSFLNLVTVLILSLVGVRSLMLVALTAGLVPTLCNILFSILLWKKADYCRPALRNVDMRYAKSIGGLGIKFFVLQIGCLLLYSTDSIIVNQLYGATAVTPYSTAYKVFNLTVVLFSSFISPVWSRITVESNRKNYSWIQRTIRNLSLLMIPICAGLFVLVCIFPTLSRWWLGKELYYEKGLIISMGIFAALNIYSSIFSSALNGMSELGIQLYVSVFISILNVPLSVFLAQNCGMGATGVIAASNVCMVISAAVVFLKTQYILKRRASGIADNI